MAFYICLALAAAVTVGSIVYYCRNRDIIGFLETPVHALLSLSLINTCILYIPWFIHVWKAEDIGHGKGLLIVPLMIVRLMQTVSLDADYETALEMVKFASVSGVSIHFLEFYAVLLSYVSVMVPVTGIMTIMGFFANQIGFVIATSRLSGKRNIYVFNGIGERNLNLAESIWNSEGWGRRNCSFLFCNVRGNPGEEARRKIGLIGGRFTGEYPSRLLRIVLYRKNRKVSFFLLEEDDLNFNNAIGILKAAGRMSGSGSRKNADHTNWKESDRVSVHLLLGSDELAGILDAQKKYGIFVRVMDAEQMYVQDLYRRLPPFSCMKRGRDSIQMMIYGKGSVAEEAFMRALWMGCNACTPLKIWYVSEDAEAFRARLRVTCPALFDDALAGGERFELCFETITETGQLYRAIGDGNPKAVDASKTVSAGMGRADFLRSDYLVLAGESDEENIRTAMWFRTWFARQIPENELQPLIAVYIRDERRAEQAENLCIQESRDSYDLHVFGTEARLFTARNILHSKLAHCLYRIQLSYSLKDLDDIPTPDQKSEAWMELNQSIYNYKSSEASAQYIVNRLYDAGALLEAMRKESGSPDREYTGYEQACFFREALVKNAHDGNRERLDTIIAIYEEKIADPKMLELLSRTEHRRWTAYMAVNGWIILPKESLVEWMKNNKGSHKDYLRLRHACMAGWEELDELSLIKTNGKDADVFKESDRRMVKGVKHFVV